MRTRNDDAMTMKEHWENIYRTRLPNEVSWFQEYPRTSVEFVTGFNLPKSAKIIDMGGGDSRLVDALLDMGYLNLHVLDISQAAIERAKKRLGDKAKGVEWIISDVTEFEPDAKFDLWHDRATFHFLTGRDEIERYVATARKAIADSGYLVVGTFSDKGPKKCSGLDCMQYSEAAMAERLKNGFEKIRCVGEDHTTPFGTRQNFLFCSFRRTAAGASV